MAFRRSTEIRPLYSNNGRHIKRQDFTDLAYDQWDGLSDNIGVSVKDFGAKGDGTTDDRAAIQAAIDSLPNGGTIIFPTAAVNCFYAVKSTNPTYAQYGLVITAKNLKFVSMSGSYDSPTIKLVLPNGTISALICALSPTNAFECCQGLYLDSICLNANHQADYAFKGDTSYVSHATIKNCQFDSGNIACISLSTYVSVIERCEAVRGTVDGFKVLGINGGPVTSLTMNSCYANNNGRHGYNFGFLTYCTLNSCACDHTPYGGASYYFAVAYCVSMNGCGVEDSVKMLLCDNARNFTINTFYGLGVGGRSQTQTTKYLMEFASGVNVIISGFYPNNTNPNQEGGRWFNYYLGLTGNGYGFENITITDGSINRSTAYFVTNYNYVNRPIKFLRGDETNKPITVNDIPNSLGLLASNINFYKLNHDYTIQLSDGIESPSDYKVFQNISGGGTLYILGNSGNNTAVTINCGDAKTEIKNCSAKIVFKNIRFVTDYSGGYGYLFNIVNSNVIFDNCVFDANSHNNPAAIIATNNSNVYLINGTKAIGGTWLPNGGKVWYADSSSVLKIGDVSAVPTSGYWDSGHRVKNSVPNAGSYEGWVCVTAGFPGVWKGFGAIQS